MSHCHRTGLVKFRSNDMLMWGVEPRVFAGLDDSEGFTLLDFLTFRGCSRRDLAAVLRNTLGHLEARQAASSYYEWLAEFAGPPPPGLMIALEEGDGWQLSRAVADARAWYDDCNRVDAAMRNNKWRQCVLKAARAAGKRRLERENGHG